MMNLLKFNILHASLTNKCHHKMTAIYPNRNKNNKQIQSLSMINGFLISKKTKPIIEIRNRFSKTIRKHIKLSLQKCIVRHQPFHQKTNKSSK